MTIAKSYSVRILKPGKHMGRTGVIAQQRPDDEPLGNPPRVKVRQPTRFKVVDYNKREDLGWYRAIDLEPYTRQPGDVPEHIAQAGRRGADLLLGKVGQS